MEEVHVEHWWYKKPNLLRNENNEIILVFQYSVGPVEYWEWGIDGENRFFIAYEWCENDFYKDESFRKEISKKEMIDKMQSMQAFYKKHNQMEYVHLYIEIEEFLIENY